ncbi:hypothetical protein C8Q75DRAFT_806736 [Abortiporus biennis]|nr:hypothetical protein C8Q75DRAFT_806736 [Abortiporus biennis]
MNSSRRGFGLALMRLLERMGPLVLSDRQTNLGIRKNHPPSTGDVLLGSLEGEDNGGGGALKSVYDCLKRNAQLRRLGPHSTPPAVVVDTGNLELVVLSTWTSLEAPHQALKAAGKLIRKIRNLCDANGVVFQYDRSRDDTTELQGENIRIPITRQRKDNYGARRLVTATFVQRPIWS